jgi:hypothetical protein
MGRPRTIPQPEIHNLSRTLRPEKPQRSAESTRGSPKPTPPAEADSARPRPFLIRYLHCYIYIAGTVGLWVVHLLERSASCILIITSESSQHARVSSDSCSSTHLYCYLHCYIFITGTVGLWVVNLLERSASWIVIITVTNLFD